VIRFVLHAANAVLIIAMIGCLAGALAGLIVLFPFVAGAWGLNLMTLLASEQNWAAGRPRRLGPRHPGGNP
jgi:hypothetical protein